jgi:exopolysaccharide production protein ExoQ
VSKSPGTLEKAFVILSLTFFTGGLGVGGGLTTPPFIPSPILTLIRYSIWMGSLTLIWLRWRTALAFASQNKLFWLLSALILLSFIWSDFPFITLKDNREVLIMTSFGLYFPLRFNIKEQVKLVALTFSIGILASLVVVLTLPSVGIHGLDHPGAWKGIYDYKNTFGSMMIISALAFFCLPVEKPICLLYKWGGFALSLTMMLLSTSKTSLVVSVLLISILFFYRYFRWRGKLSVIMLDLGILLFGGVSTIVFTFWVNILTGLGRDHTLTGRTPMWGVAIARIMNQPLLGYGRGAFWLPQGGYAHEAGAAVAPGFVPPHGHNGFIDLALDIGLIGLLIFVIIFATAYFQALKRAYATKNPVDYWPLGFLMFLVMNNVTESYLLRLENIYWILFMTVIFSVNQKKQPSNQSN